MLRSQVEMASEQKQCLEREQMELKECMSGWLHYFISSQGIYIYRIVIFDQKKEYLFRYIS